MANDYTSQWPSAATRVMGMVVVVLVAVEVAHTKIIKIDLLATSMLFWVTDTDWLASYESPAANNDEQHAAELHCTQPIKFAAAQFTSSAYFGHKRQTLMLLKPKFK